MFSRARHKRKKYFKPASETQRAIERERRKQEKAKQHGR